MSTVHCCSSSALMLASDDSRVAKTDSLKSDTISPINSNCASQLSGVACSGTGAGLGAPRRDGTSAVTRCAGTVGDEGAEVVRAVRAGIAVTHVFKLAVASSVLVDRLRARRHERQRQAIRRCWVN